jgi:hypothetical protein
MVVAKITNTTGDWITWHRSLTAGNNLRLNTAAAQTTTNAWLSVSGTTSTLASAAPTGTYVIYAWAHDTASDGFVQCGSFTTNGSGIATVDLGWEPQFLIHKGLAAIDWSMYDQMRGMAQGQGAKNLDPSSTAAENTNAVVNLSPTGFSISSLSSSNTFIYLAIRIPNKPPTSGTEVFQPVVYTGTNVDNRLVNTGMKTDMVLARVRSLSSTPGFVVGDRLRGQPYLGTATTNAELSDADSLDQQIVSSTEYGTAFSSMTGFWVGNDATANLNANTTTNNHIVEAFRRAPGFFDIVCYTGDLTNPRAIPHQLSAAPELIIVKNRSSLFAWNVYHSLLGIDKFLVLNTTAAEVTNVGHWGGSTPDINNFYISAASALNAGGVYVAYLFASLPGISKVGSYTGNGTTQTIDCGFTTGARFVLIKVANTTGNWAVFDSARGFGAGNDPFCSLNLTTAENTGQNAVDTDNSGFVVTSSLFNSASRPYIFLAIA